MDITTNRAKQIVGDELLRLGYSDIKLRARTVSFTDLVRDKCIFVQVRNFWHERRGFIEDCPECQKQRRDWQSLKNLGIRYGFRVESRNTPGGS